MSKNIRLPLIIFSGAILLLLTFYVKSYDANLLVIIIGIRALITMFAITMPTFYAWKKYENFYSYNYIVIVLAFAFLNWSMWVSDLLFVFLQTA